MAQKYDRQALRESCSKRNAAGGVYQIVNTCTGRRLICAQRDLAGSKNRFDFSVMTGGCVHPKLAQDWKQYGPKAFAFEVLESLEQTGEQTDKQFNEDLEALCALWVEKVSPEQLY